MKDKEKIKLAEEIKTDSRKYKLTMLILLISTLICAVPPVISALVMKVNTLIILSGSEWVSLISIILGFYFGVNVWQKKIFKDAEIAVGNKLNDLQLVAGNNETTTPATPATPAATPPEQTPIPTVENKPIEPAK